MINMVGYLGIHGMPICIGGAGLGREHIYLLTRLLKVISIPIIIIFIFPAMIVGSA